MKRLLRNKSISKAKSAQKYIKNKDCRKAKKLVVKCITKVKTVLIFKISIECQASDFS